MLPLSHEQKPAETYFNCDEHLDFNLFTDFIDEHQYSLTDETNSVLPTAEYSDQSYETYHDTSMLVNPQSYETDAQHHFANDWNVFDVAFQTEQSLYQAYEHRRPNQFSSANEPLGSVTIDVPIQEVLGEEALQPAGSIEYAMNAEAYVHSGPSNTATRKTKSKLSKQRIELSSNRHSKRRTIASAKSKARRAPKLEKYLNGCYGVHDFNLQGYTVSPRINYDRENNLEVRKLGQCIRCMYMRRKCSGGRPCQPCRSTDLSRPIECVGPDYQSFNVFSLGFNDLSDFLGEEKILSPELSAYAHWAYVVGNMFISFKREPEISRIRRLRAIAFLATTNETTNLAFSLHSIIMKGGESSALGLFRVSSVILTKNDYLEALCPDDRSFLFACRAQASTYLFQLLAHALRGKYHKGISSELMLTTIFMATTHLQGCLAHFESNDESGREPESLLEARSFMNRYLSEVRHIFKLRSSEYEHLINDNLETLLVTPKCRALLNIARKGAVEKLYGIIPDDIVGIHNMPPSFSVAIDLVPLSWWHEHNSCMIPRFSKGDLLAIFMAISQVYCRSNLTMSELFCECDKRQEDIQLAISIFSDIIARTFAYLRQNGGEFYLVLSQYETTGSDLWDSWSEMMKRCDDSSAIELHISDPWAQTFLSAFRCLIPCALAIEGIIDTDELCEILCLLIAGKRFTRGVVFLIFHLEFEAFLEIIGTRNQDRKPGASARIKAAARLSGLKRRIVHSIFGSLLGTGAR